MNTFPHTPWSVGSTQVPNKPGTWNSQEIIIYKDGQEWYKYTRNYSSYQPFAPFLLDGEWYALYSLDYTATRVLKLTPEPEDWCGEQRDSFGFCPVQLYVPQFRLYSYNFTFDMKAGHKVPEYTERHYTCVFPEDYVSYEATVKRKADAEMQGVREEPSLSDIMYTPFGFVCGCIWGDDTSWKIELMDLSKVASKEIKRKNVFGYIELAGNQTLEQAIDLHYIDMNFREDTGKTDSQIWRIGVTHTDVWDINLETMEMVEKF